MQIGRRMFRPDDDRQARTIEVLVQNSHQALLFLNHLQERSTWDARPTGMLPGLVDERCRAIDKECGHRRKFLETRTAQPHRACEQRVGKHPFAVFDLLHDGLTDRTEWPAGKLLAEVIGRLTQFVRISGTHRRRSLPRQLSATCDDDHEDGRSAERHEINLVKHRAFVGRRDGKPDVAGHSREHLRPTAEDIVQESGCLGCSRSRASTAGTVRV